MTQPNTSSLDIVRAVADTIKAGNDVDLATLYKGAGHAVKLAVDEQDPDFLKLAVLVSAGNYADATALLVQMAMNSPAANQQPEPPVSDDPLVDLTNAGQTPPAANPQGSTATQPKTESTTDPGPQAAPSAGTTTNPKPKRRNR